MVYLHVDRRKSLPCSQNLVIKRNSVDCQTKTKHHQHWKAEDGAHASLCFLHLFLLSILGGLALMTYHSLLQWSSNILSVFSFFSHKGEVWLYSCQFSQWP